MQIRQSKILEIERHLMLIAEPGAIFHPTKFNLVSFIQFNVTFWSRQYDRQLCACIVPSRTDFHREISNEQ